VRIKQSPEDNPANENNAGYCSEPRRRLQACAPAGGEEMMGIGQAAFFILHFSFFIEIPFQARADVRNAKQCQIENEKIQNAKMRAAAPRKSGTDYSSLLTPHSSPLTPHPSSLIPHPSSLIPHLLASAPNARAHFTHACPRAPQLRRGSDRFAPARGEKTRI
jgi:hypothetical protein